MRLSDTCNDGLLGGKIRERVMERLEDPLLGSNAPVTGVDKGQHRKGEKRKRVFHQSMQVSKYYWSHHTGEFSIPSPDQVPTTYKGYMCSAVLALHHPAEGDLLQFATKGFPTMTGKPWTLNQMEEEIYRGPHVSVLQSVAMKILVDDVAVKEKKVQCKVFMWDSIKDNPPEELNIFPISMIPHKSQLFRAILDLSFALRFKMVNSFRR